MRYMLLMHGIETDEDSPGPDSTARDSAPAHDSGPAHEDSEPCWMPWYREMTARGVGLLKGGQLQSSMTATTVRANGSEILVADGPFAETKEQILGFDVIECTDLDEAIYAASRHPVAQQGGVIEVRPILAMS
jgi:hypothetical protein